MPIEVEKLSVNIMKRDLELIRQLMLAIELRDTRFSTESIEIDGYDSSQINYHLKLMIEAELVVGKVISQFNRPPAKVRERCTIEINSTNRK